MPLYAFAAPVLPGKMEEYREFVEELNTTRKKDYEASRKNAGFSRETVFLQKTPQGDMVVIVQEAENAEKAMESLRELKDPFDVWFFERVKDIHGFDIAGGQMPSNELLIDYRS